MLKQRVCQLNQVLQTCLTVQRKNYINTKIDQLIKKTGDRMSGNLHMGGRLVAGLGTPTNPQHAVNKQYIDSRVSAQVSKRGDTRIGNLNMRNNLTRGLPTTYPPVYQGHESVSWEQAVR